MDVSKAVSSRRSVRGFLDRPVDLERLKILIQKASAAPSGGNLQPWQIHVVTGDRLIELKRIMVERVANMPKGEGSEYDIYPRDMVEPYRSRAYEVGESLYAHLGIPRENKTKRFEWFARNFQFFGATAGLFCYVNRRNGPPQWSDLGMYLQTFMLLLREEGLDSCPQECWAMYPQTLKTFLRISPEYMLFTGMAIGWKDTAEPANAMISARAPIEEFAHFHQ